MMNENKKLTKKDLEKMYYETLIEYYPYWRTNDDDILKTYANMRWERMVEEGYIEKEVAEAMRYILEERLVLLQKILGRSISEDYEKYEIHPYTFKV